MRLDRTRFSRRAGAGAIALIAALALAACGSSSGSKSPPSANAGTPSSAATGLSGFAARRVALEACLRQHGVSLPSFPGSGGFGGPRFGASGRFGPTGRFGASGRFGVTGASGRRGFFGFGASGRFGSTGRFGATGASGRLGFFGGNSKTATAFRACAADLPAGIAGGGFARPGGASGVFRASSAADRAAVNSYVACVRRHGFSLPAPNFSGTGPVFNTTQVNTRNPKFIAASGACQSLLRFAPAG